MTKLGVLESNQSPRGRKPLGRSLPQPLQFMKYYSSCAFLGVPVKGWVRLEGPRGAGWPHRRCGLNAGRLGYEERVACDTWKLCRLRAGNDTIPATSSSRMSPCRQLGEVRAARGVPSPDPKGHCGSRALESPVRDTMTGCY